MNKIELIKKITSYHPASEAGTKRDWSYYTGGMRDSGDWYYNTLLDASKYDLQQCLDELIEEWKPRPEPIYTEEDLRQQANIIKLEDGSFITEYALNQMKQFGQELEHDLFFPKK